MTLPQVVIVGAGFGGLQCARALAAEPVQALLIDRNNYHLFTPLLYQVASSLLDPSDIAYPIRSALRASPLRFRVGEVRRVEVEARQIETAGGTRIPYDFLVVATGSTTNYFGLEAMRSMAYGLKDLPEALELRNHVLRCLENATIEPDSERRRRWLTFVVVGGGPTGVECAGALAELVRLVLPREYPELDIVEVRILMIELSPRVLAMFPEPLGREAERVLRRRGVDVRLGARVTAASADAITLATGETIASRTVIWAAGVKPAALAFSTELPRTGLGRIEVDEYLRVRGRTDMFAIGDVASCKQDGRELPMLAPPAMQQGRFVAATIGRIVRGEPLAPFRYRDRGIMATIGRNAAVAQTGRLSMKGFAGWVAWLLLHLYFLIGFRNRIAVLLRWAWNYVFYDRPVRIIVRANARDSPDEGERGTLSGS